MLVIWNQDLFNRKFFLNCLIAETINAKHFNAMPTFYCLSVFNEVWDFLCFIIGN